MVPHKVIQFHCYIVIFPSLLYFNFFLFFNLVVKFRFNKKLQETHLIINVGTLGFLFLSGIMAVIDDNSKYTEVFLPV